MRILLIVFLLAVFVCFYGLSRPRYKLATGASTTALTVDSGAAPARVDFDTQIKPILQQKCQPCHFTGGTQYARLPFDRPETIQKLGTRLFTRLKEEKEQELIRQFLAQK